MTAKTSKKVINQLELVPLDGREKERIKDEVERKRRREGKRKLNFLSFYLSLSLSSSPGSCPSVRPPVSSSNRKFFFFLFRPRSSVGLVFGQEIGLRGRQSIRSEGRAYVTRVPRIKARLATGLL